MSGAVEYRGCEKCDEGLGVVVCSCGAEFCEQCFGARHLRRNPNHRRGGTKKLQAYWNWVSGELAGLTNPLTQASHFKKDESAKWFGIHTETARDGKYITSIVDTERLTNLVETSLHFEDSSPNRQFPSIASFVGETGAGMSTLSMSCYSHLLKW